MSNQKSKVEIYQALVNSKYHPTDPDADLPDTAEARGRILKAIDDWAAITPDSSRKKEILAHLQAADSLDRLRDVLDECKDEILTAANKERTLDLLAEARIHQDAALKKKAFECHFPGATAGRKNNKLAGALPEMMDEICGTGKFYVKWEKMNLAKTDSLPEVRGKIKHRNDEICCFALDRETYNMYVCIDRKDSDNYIRLVTALNNSGLEPIERSISAQNALKTESITYFNNFFFEDENHKGKFFNKNNEEPDFIRIDIDPAQEGFFDKLKTAVIARRKAVLERDEARKKKSEGSAYIPLEGAEADTVNRLQQTHLDRVVEDEIWGDMRILSNIPPRSRKWR